MNDSGNNASEGAALRVRKKRRFEVGPPPGNVPAPAQPNLINAAVAKALQMVRDKANGVEPTEMCGEVIINDCLNRGLMIRSSTHQTVFQQCGALVMTRGRYIADMTNSPAGERPLHLHITAKTQAAIDAAVSMLTELMSPAHPPPAPAVERVPIQIAGCEGPEWEAWLANRIRGPSSSYLGHIEQQSGCRLHLQGRGSGQALGEPLHAVLSAVDRTAQATGRLVLANQLLASLLSTIRVELSQRQQPTGANVYGSHEANQSAITGAPESPAVVVPASCIEPPLVFTGIAPPANAVRNQTSRRTQIESTHPREWLRQGSLV